MAKVGSPISGGRVLAVGLAFKENCLDLRNSRVVDIIVAIQDHSVQVEVHDPRADEKEAREEYGTDLCADPRAGSYDAIILAVAHDA